MISDRASYFSLINRQQYNPRQACQLLEKKVEEHSNNDFLFSYKISAPTIKTLKCFKQFLAILTADSFLHFFDIKLKKKLWKLNFPIERDFAFNEEGKVFYLESQTIPIVQRSLKIIKNEEKIATISESESLKFNNPVFTKNFIFTVDKKQKKIFCCDSDGLIKTTINFSEQIQKIPRKSGEIQREISLGNNECYIYLNNTKLHGYLTGSKKSVSMDFSCITTIAHESNLEFRLYKIFFYLISKSNIWEINLENSKSSKNYFYVRTPHCNRNIDKIAINKNYIALLFNGKNIHYFNKEKSTENVLKNGYSSDIDVKLFRLYSHFLIISGFDKKTKLGFKSIFNLKTNQEIEKEIYTDSRYIKFFEKKCAVVMLNSEKLIIQDYENFFAEQAEQAEQAKQKEKNISEKAAKFLA